MSPRPIELEALHCTIRIERPTGGVVVVTVEGVDVGELGEAPFEALEPLLEGPAAIDLFIDARNTKGASVEVSGAWALWFMRRRERLRSVNMLTRSRQVAVSAEFARRFAGLGERMRITTDGSAFDWALSFAVLR